MGSHCHRLGGKKPEGPSAAECAMMHEVIVYTVCYEEYERYQRWCNNKIFILVLYSLGVLSAGFYLLLTTWWPGQGFIVPVS